jgi:peroxiredoxin Q/BCP
VILVLAIAMLPQEPRIEKGEKAPEFALKNQKDAEVKLSDFKDKKNLLLAFYPKDATPG